MELYEKKRYEVPLTAVFEIKQKGVVCASELSRQDYVYEEW